jgi:predicted glycosyltransferase
MKILIDIGHPAHVHYFKNFIRLMTQKGHQFHITARNKEVVFDLLKKYDIPYTDRGRGGKGLLGKILYILLADIKLIHVGLRFKPDIILSFASTYAAHTSFILKRPHIAFDDTEHSRFEIFLYRPFTKVILNPKCFQSDFGEKQIRFMGFIELCYLHPNYFNPDNNIVNQLGLKEEDRFILIRFVSWSAGHDMGESGFSPQNKISLVKALSKKVRVFISSENSLPVELEPFLLPISPDKLHHVLFYASLYIGEGATTASECAMLGTPAIYVNSLSAGTLEEQEKLGLLFSFRNSDGVLEKALEILNTPEFKFENRIRRDNMLKQTIDVTAFMVWFIENYPGSVKTMKENPDYQWRFK